ncbi:hypothetical protein, partial [Campylobacter upsaliensis]|uniref:hypothetical protein n=1 Tax=Campylobacter upsaliensis TaxID=28080 RepID=UPI0022EA7EB5
MQQFSQTLTGGGVTHMSSKKPLLSLACILALSCVIEANDITNEASQLPLNERDTNILRVTQETTAGITQDQSLANSRTPLQWTTNDHGNSIKYLNFSTAYRDSIAFGKFNITFNDGTTVETLKIDTKAYGNNKKVWTNIENTGSATITTLNLKNDTKTEFNAGSKSNTITTLNHEAIRLNLKTGSGGTINVTTLNQSGTAGDTQLFNGVSIQTVNLTAGKFYQYAGTINTLHIKNGTEFRQGLKDNGTISNDGDGGTITNLTIDNGTFTKAKGSVTGTITNTNGNINNMGNSSINTITSTNGNITNAGTITSLTYTAAPTTKAIQTKANTDSITNTGIITTLTNDGGHITNSGNGNITNLTNSNGNVNNSANIQTYTQESGNTMQSGGTIQTLTQKGGSFTYAGGQINNLTQSGGSFNNLQQNISLFTTQGGSLNNIQGTIENLKITSGDFELNNMQQGRIANIEIGGNGKININDNMNIGYHNGISTFRIASGATPTLNFGEVRTATTAQETYATVKLVDTNNANTTQARVAIDKLTIALVSEDTQIGKSVSLANSVSGAA